MTLEVNSIYLIATKSTKNPNNSVFAEGIFKCFTKYVIPKLGNMPWYFFYKIVILIDQIFTNKNCEFSLGKICRYKIRKCPDTFVTGVYMIYFKKT